jgi:hypothetical protein
MSTDLKSVVFSRQNEKKQQMSRQVDSRFDFPRHSIIFVNAFLAVTSHFSTYRHFLCRFVLPFWVSFHSLHEKASFAQKSLS